MYVIPPEDTAETVKVAVSGTVALATVTVTVLSDEPGSVKIRVSA